MESNTEQDTDIHVQADRSFKAIRILPPLPSVILAGLYCGSRRRSGDSGYGARIVDCGGCRGATGFG